MIFSDYLKQLEERIYLASNLKNNNLEYKKQNILVWKIIEYIVNTDKINIKEEVLNNLKMKIFLYNIFNEKIINENIKKNLIHIEKLNISNQNELKSFIENVLTINTDANDIINNIKLFLENDVYINSILDSDIVFDYFMGNLIKIFDY